MTYRLQRPLVWIGGWLVWCVALSAAWARGWSLSPARPWFPALLALTLAVAALACRYWWPRWHTVTVARDGSSLELRSLTRRETVPLEPPVRCRLYDQTVTGEGLVDSGARLRLMSVRTAGKRAELFVTSGDRSIVLSARGRRRRALRAFAEAAAPAMAGEPLTVERHTLPRIAGGFRRRDPSTQWLNPDAGSSGGRHMLGVVAFAVVALFLTVGALPAAAYGPTSPAVVSRADAERRLGYTLDRLGTDVASLDLPAVDGLSIDVDVESRRCRRDEEWFWGPGRDASLEASAVITFDLAAVPAVRERVDAVADDQGSSEREAWRYRPDGDSRDVYTLDIELAEVDADIEHVETDVDLVDLAVSFDTRCLSPHDRDALDPIAHDHARRMAETLAGPP